MKIIKCIRCQRERYHHARGFCQSCYNTERLRSEGKRKKTECSRCLKQKHHHAKGLCHNCYVITSYTKEELNKYAREHYAKNPERRKKVIIRQLTRNKYKKDKCQHCDSKESLEFHHLLNEKGEYDIDLFLILCRNCHLKETAQKSMLEPVQESKTVNQ